MNRTTRPDSAARAALLNETLAHWFGRLSAAPTPEHLIDAVDQLERDHCLSMASSAPLDI
jgi:hypothetical protein